MGESIQGKWINKITGQVINVRDSVIDGDNMIIISDIGNLSMEEFSNNYIQGSDELYDESGHVVGKQEMTMDEIRAIGNNNLNAGVNNIQQAQSILEVSSPVIEEPKNNQIIKKVFDKLNSVPEPNIEIKWDSFPEAQINTLIDFLDIDIDEISEYIYNNYINKDNIIMKISEFLRKQLNK